ncbi:family 20 glycosylhydrolase, partial [Candidatus Bathyarchaeota archaeon]|nr:family 20 glycosylhydrolase [Candidatus Bathyarchaeota archaeon]
GSEGESNSIFITIGNSGDYRDVVGRETHEGYTLKTDEESITITGASPLGAWWGTRTVLQQAILSDDGSVPAGSGVDAPGWGTRGMMIDCARRHYPKEWLLDMCSYMSFFKQNTFQLHLSDNQIVKDYSTEVYKDIPAHFRLWSDSEAVAGLNPYRNESYTRDDFEEIQTKCAARGVAILPEIEAPGHALPIVQWKPQLAYDDNHSLLNISHPDTIPTMKTIWGEFLPWFHSKIVSIGADEYEGPAKEYKQFVNAMNEFIVKESGKQVRIWGTFPPAEETKDVEIPTDVLIQHWSFSFDNPVHDYINNDYQVINTDETYYGRSPTFPIK